MDPRSGGKKNFLTQCACRYPIFGEAAKRKGKKFGMVKLTKIELFWLSCTTSKKAISLIWRPIMPSFDPIPSHWSDKPIGMDCALNQIRFTGKT